MYLHGNCTGLSFSFFFFLPNNLIFTIYIVVSIRLYNRRAEDYLNGLLVKMAADRGLDAIDRLTEEFHVYPDFHGNRSPVADPTLKGMVRVGF